MARLSFSGSEKSIETIWSWYADQKEALRDFKYKVINSLTTSINLINPKFLTYSLDEINRYFDDSETELEHLVCFSLISATEAHLRLDFYKRVYDKDKSELGRIFRDIHKEKEDKISLETDIIENWKEYAAAKKKYFSDYLGVLNYRHWLAHGRYWTPKLGQNYNVSITYDISDNIFQTVVY